MSFVNRRRIINNTMTLYFRQILILFVTLYTIRVVLQELGVDDYGIFVTVGSLVILSNFLPGSVVQASQRYFANAIGQSDDLRLKQVFSVNIILFLGIGLICVLLLETLGLWFVLTHLVIPPERLEAAIITYHISVLMFFFSVVTTLFTAMIVAHEDMKIYAHISILEALLRLAVVMMLQFINYDKLILYAALTAGVSIINFLLFLVICLRRYTECQFRHFYWNTTLFRDIFGFTGWTVFGQLAALARGAALTILLNQMFGPAVAAARAIAEKITQKINLFSTNFNTSLYPPIVKTYAARQMDEMYGLIKVGTRISFFLLWIIAFPMMLEMDAILNIWLTVVPPNATLFAQLALVEALIYALSIQIVTVARAYGKMRGYELTIGVMQICTFLISWSVLRMGAPAYSVLVVAAVMAFFIFGVRLFLVKRMIGFPVFWFLGHALWPVLVIVITSAVPTLLFKSWLSDTLFASALVVTASFVLSCVAMYFIGLDREWREKLHKFIWDRLSRVLKV